MNIAFVTSTLPASILNEYTRDLQIDKIVCVNRDILDSYAFLKEKYSGIDLISLPEDKLKQIAFLFKLMINRQNSIIVFHECCWLFLDLLIILLRPRGDFYPVVTLNSFKLLEERELHFKNILGRIRKNQSIVFRMIKAFLVILLKSNFHVYLDKADGGEGDYFVFSLKMANISTINTHEIGHFPGKKLFYGKNKDKNLSILIVFAREQFADEMQINLYKKICEYYLKRGYKVYLKDHPRPGARLGFEFPGAVVLPAVMPIEVVDRDFDWVIGMASTSLIKFGKRALCLVNCLEIDESIKKSRIAHLLSLTGGNEINYIQNIDELYKITCGHMA